MGKYEAAENGLNLWDRFRLIEPAMLRGILTAIAAAFAIWGINLSPWADRVSDTWALLFPIIPIIQGWWTRTVVSPSEINGID